MATLRSNPLLIPELYRYPEYVGTWGKVRLELRSVSRTLADSRPLRVFCLLVGVWLFSAFDYMLTLIAHGTGMAAELNPLAEWFLVRGPLPLLIFKAGLVLLGSIGLIRFRRRLIAELATFVMFAVLFSVVWRWKIVMDIHEFAASCAPSGYFRIG